MISINLWLLYFLCIKMLVLSFAPFLFSFFHDIFISSKVVLLTRISLIESTPTLLMLHSVSDVSVLFASKLSFISSTSSSIPWSPQTIKLLPQQCLMITQYALQGKQSFPLKSIYSKLDMKVFSKDFIK